MHNFRTEVAFTLAVTGSIRVKFCPWPNLLHCHLSMKPFVLRIGWLRSTIDNCIGSLSHIKR